MCAIHPKRKQFFSLEFYTSGDITDEEWQKLVLERILELEQVFNASGEIRVHINEREEKRLRR